MAGNFRMICTQWRSVCRRVLLGAVVLLLLCFIVTVSLQHNAVADDGDDVVQHKLARLRASLKFAAADSAIAECTELFSADSATAAFQMSTEFSARLPDFLLAVRNATPNRDVDYEGHSYRYEKIYRTLHYLASELNFVRTICETGFNVGHSAFNFLTAKPTNVLYTFDIGKHHYSRPMATYLRGLFGDRFRVTFGDSTKKLPAFVEQYAGDIVCDLIHVDGGHSFEVAVSDLENFSRLASLARPGRNVIVLDNVNYKAVGRAWKLMVERGIVRELLRCRLHQPNEDELVIAMYIKRAEMKVHESP